MATKREYEKEIYLALFAHMSAMTYSDLLDAISIKPNSLSDYDRLSAAQDSVCHKLAKASAGAPSLEGSDPESADTAS